MGAISKKIDTIIGDLVTSSISLHWYDGIYITDGVIQANISWHNHLATLYIQLINMRGIQHKHFRDAALPLFDGNADINAITRQLLLLGNPPGYVDALAQIKLSIEALDELLQSDLNKDTDNRKAKLQELKTAFNQVTLTQDMNEAALAETNTLQEMLSKDELTLEATPSYTVTLPEIKTETFPTLATNVNEKTFVSPGFWARVGTTFSKLGLVNINSFRVFDQMLVTLENGTAKLFADIDNLLNWVKTRFKTKPVPTTLSTAAPLTITKDLPKVPQFFIDMTITPWADLEETEIKEKVQLFLEQLKIIPDGTLKMVLQVNLAEEILARFESNDPNAQCATKENRKAYAEIINSSIFINFMGDAYQQRMSKIRKALSDESFATTFKAQSKGELLNQIKSWDMEDLSEAHLAQLERLPEILTKIKAESYTAQEAYELSTLVKNKFGLTISTVSEKDSNLKLTYVADTKALVSAETSLNELPELLELVESMRENYSPQAINGLRSACYTHLFNVLLNGTDEQKAAVKSTDILSRFNDASLDYASSTDSNMSDESLSNLTRRTAIFS